MKKRYSYLIKPLQIITDLIVINSIIYVINDKVYYNLLFISYINVFWIISTYILGFYKVYRHTNYLRIFTLLLKEFSVFILGYFAFFSIFREVIVVNNQLLTFILITISITILKLTWLFLLHKYRSLGNNYRTTIVVGYDDSSRNIIKLFKSKSNLGYKYLGFFSSKYFKNLERLGDEKDIHSFLDKKEVDEIYCSLKSTSSDCISQLKKLSLQKNIGLKLIPDVTNLYSKTHNIEYYDDTLMVLNVEKLPFEFAENYIIKRFFDICFSIIVCVSILSWLYPIMWILIKVDSKGPVIFSQKREGLNGEHFVCYKFRSMKINKFSDKIHASKNDTRVTKIGSFLRKTSLDELPQFVNVLKGDMSVVGPRPHLESLSLEYQKEVDNYLKRHLMKPGITGLAQISGYRGEIKKRSDIKNRVRLDIFYIENWSFFLDIKIIIQTILSVFQGDEKAY